MARCRFFDGFHDYAQDECDRGFCRRVLDGVKARLIPLPMIPEPETCDHEWEVYFAKIRVPWSHRNRPDWDHRASTEMHVQQGLLLMDDCSFSVCEICGAVSYNHRELGGPILCLPRPRKAPCAGTISEGSRKA